MAQIFLSYSRKDSDAAKAFASALNDGGHAVWWDKRISGGSKFAAEIEQALGEADIVMVLWSINAIGSSWVLDEAAEGRDSGRLLPVALDDCKPPLGFRQFQTIAANGRLDAALDEVLVAIGQKSGGGRQAPASAGGPGGIAPGTASHCATARRLASLGQFDHAWREIEAALSADPDCAEANREAGWLLYVQGRPAEAIVNYEKAARGSKNDHESPAMLISCYRAIEDEAGLNRAAAVALARAEQAIAGAAPSAPAFASGAKGLAALRHGERARKWIRKALNIEPGNLKIHYCLAATLARFLDDGDAAIDVLEPFTEVASKPIDLQLLEADPDWTVLRETRAFQRLLGQVRKRIEAVESMSLAGGQVVR